MLPVLQFIFSSFWVWLGLLLLVDEVGKAAARIIIALRKK